MTVSHAEARAIVERVGPHKPGSLGWLFAETGAVPMVWPTLLYDLAIQDKDDELALVTYLEAAGPRPSLPGWDRISS